MDVPIVQPTYKYRAECLKVHDGDTFFARIDLGMYVDHRVWIRVRGLYCPELNEEGGEAAKEGASRLLTGRDLIIETIKDKQSFARWIADVWIIDSPFVAQFAVEMIYGGFGKANP